MHLIIFVIFGLSIAIFDELDNEMFAGLFWGFLILGTLGAYIQSSSFKRIRRSLKLTKLTCFLSIFLVELIYMNLAYILQGAKPMTWLLVTGTFEKSDDFLTIGATFMHIGILISTFVATYMITSNYQLINNKGNL